MRVHQAYISIVFSLLCFSVSSAQPDSTGHPIETPEQAVELALMYSGFDRFAGLVLPSPDAMAHRSTTHDYTMPHLADSVNGRETWQVTFNDIAFNGGEFKSVDHEHADIETLEVVLNQKTGQLVQMRMTRPGLENFPSTFLESVKAEVRWFGNEEAYHSLCSEKPHLSLVDALRQSKSYPMDAVLLIGSYVMGSYTFRGEKGPQPLWSITCLYPGPHELIGDLGENTYTVKRLVVDAKTGDLLLDYAISGTY